MMENNLANISAIYPHTPIQLGISKNESFDMSYFDRKQALKTIEETKQHVVRD